MPETNELSRKMIEHLGVDPDNLGFVGLDVALPSAYQEVLSEEWAYVSPNAKYINGLQVNPHVTLIYGLLFSAKDNQDVINDALQSWYKPDHLVMGEVDVFTDTDSGEDYSVVVLRPDKDSLFHHTLKEANDCLRVLPHVCNFPVYKPHVTLGYIKPEFAMAARDLVRDIPMRHMFTKGLDYGD